MDSTFTTRGIKTPFSGKNNMESLTYDKANNRLLLVPKNKDLNSKSYKGIYVFNLENHKIDEKPILKISMTDSIFLSKRNKGKKGETKDFYPSDIAINPLDGNIYVLEGKNRSEEHTSELQSRPHLVCRLLLEKKKKKTQNKIPYGQTNMMPQHLLLTIVVMSPIWPELCHPTQLALMIALFCLCCWHVSDMGYV